MTMYRVLTAKGGNPKETAAAHLWDGNDTYCKMASTGGLNKNRLVPVKLLGTRRICQMCRNNFKKN